MYVQTLPWQVARWRSHHDIRRLRKQYAGRSTGLIMQFDHAVSAKLPIACMLSTCLGFAVMFASHAGQGAWSTHYNH